MTKAACQCCCFYLQGTIMIANGLFTSESVSEGHPDKVADQISDAIVDAALREDPNSRVACEVLVKTGMVIVAEMTTETYTVEV